MTDWTRQTPIELLDALRDGDLPRWPQDELIGLSVAAAKPGVVELRWDPTPEACNPAGAAHGGYIAMALDNAVCMAAATLGDTFVPQLTLSLSIDYLRALLPGTSYTVRGEVVHSGKSRTVVNGSITEPTGRVAAQAHAAVTANRAFVNAGG